MNLKDIVFALSAAAGPAGFEDQAADRAAALLRPYMDEVSRDVMGNVTGVRHSSKPGAKRILLDAHIDEVGLIITGHADGFLKFSTLGGIDPRVLPTQEVMLLTQPPVYGVIATMPPHVLSSTDMDKTCEIPDLFIDAGLSEEETAAIAPGTPVVFSVEPCTLAGSCISAKSLDDRLCFASILRALELLGNQGRNVELYVTASTQEELGMRGAKTAVFSIEPDLAIALDVTHASTPDNPDESLMSLGKGVVIDVGPGMTRSISQRFLALAQEKKIPYQIEVEAGCTGTNGWAFQVSRSGVACGLLSIPLRYMHSPVETCNLSDAEAAAQLLCAYICSLGEGETYA